MLFHPAISSAPDALLQRPGCGKDAQRRGRDVITGTDTVQDLVDRFDGRLRRYVSRFLEPVDVDDALHDIYARLARQATRIPPPSFNSTYVFKTADGVLRDLHRRRRSRDAGRHVELTEDIPSDTPTPFESTRWKQNLDLLRAAILSLPRQERLVLMMHRVEGRKLTEIAESQRIPLRTVQQLLAQALARCRGKLKEDGWFEQ